MKKITKPAVIIICGALAVAMIAILAVTGGNKKTASSTAKNTKAGYTAIGACRTPISSLAQKVAGKDAKIQKTAPDAKAPTVGANYCADQPVKEVASPGYVVREACSLLTSSLAQKVAGKDAKIQKTAPDANPSGINTSYCAYRSAKEVATLYVRAPLTKVGSDANKAQFSSGRPTTAQVVMGYGDAAYWDPRYSQLDILKHNTWYVLAVGSSNPTTRTLDQAKQFANLMIDKF